MSGLSASLAFEKKGTVRYRYTVSERATTVRYLHTYIIKTFLRFCGREVYIFASEEVQCRYVVINYNYRPDFKSEVLLFCKNYDNLAFLLGEFSISRTLLGAYLLSSNANFESITGWKQVLACCDTIPLSAVIWAPETFIPQCC